ncbi:MAG: GAF domain-containing protein, partial [Dehalococcoidia bacterium]|nr:GAF domain-containing protein [Dehalococcoidia bacterium]
MPVYASPPRASLQRRIVLLVVGGMVVVLVGFGISSFLAVRESIGRTLQERLAVARTTAGHLEYVLQQNLKRLEDIAFVPGIDLEDRDLEPEKRAVHDAYLYSIFNDGVLLLSKEGAVLWAEPNSLQTTTPGLDGLPHVRRALETGRAGFSSVFVESSGKAVVSAMAPLRNRAGEIVGIAVGNIDLSSASLLKTLPVLSLGQTGYIEVVDGNGVVIASSNLQRVLQESDHGNILADLIKRRKETSGTCHSCHAAAEQEQRETEVLAFAPLPTFPWGISIRQSEREALGPARNLERSFVIMGLVLLGISLGMAWGTARSVVRPIGVLIDAARRISSGNLTEPIPNQGKDELGLLSQSLDEMREKLRLSHEELDRLNRELEKRAADRTKELAALVQTSQALALLTLDLDTLLRSIIETAMKTLEGADAGALLLYDTDTGKLVARSSLGYDLEALSRVRLNPGEAIVGKVFATGEAMMYSTPEEVSRGISDAAPGNMTWLFRARSGAQPQSAICVPLRSKEKTLGSLILVSLSRSNAFSPLDLRLLSAFAAQAALAIENATLYEELQRKEALRGELLRKVITAQEDERKRIARDLHDDTSQYLAA